MERIIFPRAFAAYRGKPVWEQIPADCRAKCTEEAAAAIEQFKCKHFGGCNLTVNEAKPGTDRGCGGRSGYEREPRW